ncbi:hypothetical protein ANN_02676 [Periplaneta americana]|uniref:Uncharacterized protein n=1 Tax=Periplaneta americana TaxID=6978 RepID=A0ABQ8TZE5_PERAM|nr:hypothetical protein ANN_02676 [Periplaneta americana]
MSPGSSTENYPAFAHIGLRENPGKNLNQNHLKAVVYTTPVNDAEDLLQRVENACQLNRDDNTNSPVVFHHCYKNDARLIPFEDLSLATILPIMHVRYLSDYAMNYLALERKRPMQTSDVDDDDDYNDVKLIFETSAVNVQTTRSIPFVLLSLRQHLGDRKASSGASYGTSKTTSS